MADLSIEVAQVSEHFTFLEVPLVGGAPRAPGAGGVCRVVTRVDTFCSSFSSIRE